MPKTAIDEETIRDDPFRSANGVGSRALVAGSRVETGKSIDGPTIFARVNMLINARHAALAPLRITKREIIRRMFTRFQIRILAGVKRAFGASEKIAEIRTNFFGRI